MSDTALLSVRDLTVSFPAETVLKNISFAINRGDFLAIIGPNGAGKSVLVKTLLGLHPHQGVLEWAPSVRIGYVPQLLDLDRYISVTLNDFLGIKMRLLKLPDEKLTEVTQSVGLNATSLQTQMRHLSVGQLQRGLIAFALLGNPDILLCDEPTASIDGPGEEQIYQTLHRLQDRYQIAVVLVSHELDLVSRFANKILCINREMICFDETQAALKPEILGKLYGEAKMHVHKL